MVVDIVNLQLSYLPDGCDCFFGVANTGQVAVSVGAVNHDLASYRVLVGRTAAGTRSNNTQGLDKLSILTGGGGTRLTHKQTSRGINPTLGERRNVVGVAAVDVDCVGGAVVERGLAVESDDRGVCDIQCSILAPVVDGGEAVNARLDRRHGCTFILCRIEGIVGNGGTVTVQVDNITILHYQAHCIHTLRGRGIAADTFEHKHHSTLLISAVQLACVFAIDAEKRFVAIRLGVDTVCSCSTDKFCGRDILFLTAEADGKAFPSGGRTCIRLNRCPIFVNPNTQPLVIGLCLDIKVTAFLVNAEAFPRLQFTCCRSDRRVGGIDGCAQILTIGSSLESHPTIGGNGGYGEGFPGGSAVTVAHSGSVTDIAISAQILTVLDGLKRNGLACKVCGDIGHACSIAGITGVTRASGGATILLVIRRRTPCQAPFSAGDGVKDLVLGGRSSNQIDGITRGYVITGISGSVLTQRAVELAGAGRFGMSGVITGNCGEGDIRIDALARSGVRHIGPISTVGTANIQNVELIYTVINVRAGRSTVSCRAAGRKIAAGIRNGLAGTGESKSLCVVGTGQNIKAGGRCSQHGVGNHTAKSDQCQEQGEKPVLCFHV